MALHHDHLLTTLIRSLWSLHFSTPFITSSNDQINKQRF